MQLKKFACVCIRPRACICAQKIKRPDASRHKRISVSRRVFCSRTFGMYYKYRCFPAKYTNVQVSAVWECWKYTSIIHQRPVWGSKYDSCRLDSYFVQLGYVVGKLEENMLKSSQMYDSPRSLLSKQVRESGRWRKVAPQVMDPFTDGRLVIISLSGCSPLTITMVKTIESQVEPSVAGVRGRGTNFFVMHSTRGRTQHTVSMAFKTCFFLDINKSNVNSHFSPIHLLITEACSTQ